MLTTVASTMIMLTAFYPLELSTFVLAILITKVRYWPTRPRPFGSSVSYKAKDEYGGSLKTGQDLLISLLTNLRFLNSDFSIHQAQASRWSLFSHMVLYVRTPVLKTKTRYSSKTKWNLEQNKITWQHYMGPGWSLNSQDLLIHSANPQTQSVVIIIFAQISFRTSVHTYFRPHWSKYHKTKETSCENNDHYW